MTHTITLIPGDGIGPEVSNAVKQILSAAGVDIRWEEVPARAEIERRGMDFMQAGVLESIRKNRVALKGPLTTGCGGWAAQHQRGFAPGSGALCERAAQ